jgi:hypothetical protein
MNQTHHATVTKDRTGKFQDETIEKPGEDFGIALYDWLTSGTAVTPTSTAEKSPVKPLKSVNTQSIQNTEKPVATSNGQSLKEHGDGVIKEIGGIITAVNNGIPYFTEDEKEEARQIIKSTKLDDKGLSDLREFKIFLSDELTKRETKKAA